jgi:death-on-curing protein
MNHLSERFILHIHAQLIDTFGGSHGVRDHGLLASALSQPQMYFDGQPLHSGVIETAAAYAFHLCQNHPFNDGNKRVAAVAMGTFLKINGVETTLDEVELYEAIMELARGNLDKAALTAWLKVRVPADTRR